MKRLSLYLLIFVVLAWMLVGCSYSRKASPINLPPIDQIGDITITGSDGTQALYADKEMIERIISVITQSIPTAKQSVQDCPQVDNYGEIDISNNGGTTTIFYYRENGRNYIEQPYQGIYETEADMDTYAITVE